MKTSLGLNDDYACMSVQGDNSWEDDQTKLSFYYGYEVTETDQDDSQWMFQVKRNNIVLKEYTTKQLEENTERKLYEPVEYLLIGINMYLNWVMD